MQPQSGRRGGLKWKQRNEELPRVGQQYTYLGVEFSKGFMWDVHIKKVTRK